MKGTSKHFMKMEAEKQKRVLDNCVEYYKEQAVRLTNNMPNGTLLCRMVGLLEQDNS